MQGVYGEQWRVLGRIHGTILRLPNHPLGVNHYSTRATVKIQCSMINGTSRIVLDCSGTQNQADAAGRPKANMAIGPKINIPGSMTKNF